MFGRLGSFISGIANRARGRGAGSANPSRPRT